MPDIDMSEWSSMDSAPKDRWIFLRGGRVDFDNTDQFNPPFVLAKWIEPGSSWYEPHWRFSQYDSGFYGKYESPLEWADIPTSLLEHRHV